MQEGNIIRFYREKANMTQTDLGKGICSATHISKVERGLTEYSPELITDLSNKLGINMEQERRKFKKIQKKLMNWHDAMIKQRSQQIESIKQELETHEWICILKENILYSLLSARYLLMQQEEDKAYQAVTKLLKYRHAFTPFEDSLCNHLLGICYLSRQEFTKALDALTQISDTDYPNPEYLYHLGIAYHYMNSRLMAHENAVKALKAFKENNNLPGIINAEMLRLGQLQEMECKHSEQMIKDYESLIQICDLCHATEKKAKGLHNLGSVYFHNKDYKNASELYLKSMALKPEGSKEYILSLEAYVHSCIKGALLPKDELLKLSRQGLHTSQVFAYELYEILFILHIHYVQKHFKRYYNHIHKKALPYFKTNGHISYLIQYEKELYNYYLQTNQLDQALEVATSVINREVL
ncbi:helix-turn-helix domain-containing protein [Ectobacillus sp. JY-23]|uniref:helix-turn-helix domain-containing protein n=1 Tax=Ectobacillus sp. JY-23 TaxID=2933872 RepID=UPI001FF52E4D|nr:helix-turn-helix transcriptional regulator [Ectobacillus sp. JY-23]UOY92473.1 helix-turn-helix domain-containing protein [Ectobacillus sp. JY-23]